MVSRQIRMYIGSLKLIEIARVPFSAVSFFEFHTTEIPTWPPPMPALFGLRPIRNGHKEIPTWPPPMPALFGLRPIRNGHKAQVCI
jgi:hypothetical protein